MKKSTLAINALAIAFVAIFIKQAGHESAHGILATLVGAKWTQLNLFFADSVWKGEPNQIGNAILTGGAAILNIVIAFIAAWMFNRKSIASNASLRLFLFYLTAYNLFAGFGYLFTDPLFYQPGGENLGDWKKIVDMLGGGWNVRLPISLIGAAGVLWGFFWVARNAHAFIPPDKPERFRSALWLLLFPYVTINILFTAFAIFGPLPDEIVLIIAIQYWFGYFGIGWGAFMSGLWIQAPGGLERSGVPESIQWGWVVASILLLVFSIFVLLPTIQFS
ncbi:MAG TPA: hypothetical protein DCX53_02780 [Anaerolineae bacterium]|nr:hypothetical protein [Anaerolineae bacterium]